MIQGEVLTRSHTFQSGASATGNGTALDVRGFSAVVFQISGTFSATITFECTQNGTDWVSLQTYNISDGTVDTTATNTGVYVAVFPAGLDQVRARISSYTSGSVSVTGTLGTVAPGSTLADIDIQAAETVSISSITIASSIVNGQKTVTAAGTAEALGSSTTLVSGVRVKALAANAGDVYVGNSSVSSANGFVLASGEEVFIEVDDLSKIYIDVSTSGEGVSYIGA